MEELPQMPEPRSSHACAAIPSTKVRLTQLTHAFMFRHSSLLGAMHLDLDICHLWSPSSLERQPGLALHLCHGQRPRYLPRLLGGKWGWLGNGGVLRWGFESYLIPWYGRKIFLLTIYSCQVLEYQPDPSNQWTIVGNIETWRSKHALLSITPELLPCLEGWTGWLEFIITVRWSRYPSRLS